MVGVVSGITGFIITISLFSLFVLGIYICKKRAFNPGIYFFILLIVHESYSLIGKLIIRGFFDSVALGDKALPFNMTVGEIAALFSLIPELLLFSAFAILIHGLYKYKFISKS